MLLRKTCISKCVLVTLDVLHVYREYKRIYLSLLYHSLYCWQFSRMARESYNVVQVMICSQVVMLAIVKVATTMEVNIFRLTLHEH